MLDGLKKRIAHGYLSVKNKLKLALEVVTKPDVNILNANKLIPITNESI